MGPGQRQSRSSLVVGLIGHGAIGGPVAAWLRAGRVPGARLGGVLRRDAPDGDGAAGEEVADVDALIERCDLVVEAAGQRALAQHGPPVVEAGRDLLVVSAGALADPSLRERLGAGTGRVTVTNGAVGGLDALRAAALDDGLAEVRLTTTKPPSALERPWMDADLRGRLRAGTEAVTVFDGTAAEAVHAFPASVNVAATLALATLGFDRTRVRVAADPARTTNEHVIDASGPVGTYRLAFANRPSDANPRTSELTVRSVLRALGDRSSLFVVGG